MVKMDCPSFSVLFSLLSFVLGHATGLKCAQCAEVDFFPGCHSFSDLKGYGVNLADFGPFTSKMNFDTPDVCLTVSMKLNLDGSEYAVLVRSGMSQIHMTSFHEEVDKVGGKWRPEGRNMNCTQEVKLNPGKYKFVAGGSDVELLQLNFCECNTDNCNKIRQLKTEL